MSNVITVFGDSGTMGTVTVNSSVPSGGTINPDNVAIGTGNTTPGTGTGPGGIGTGDGGFETASDTTITTPTITYPSNTDNTNVSDASTATSSAFAATESRTHKASRWMIVYLGAGTDEKVQTNQSPVVFFDSGVTTSNLTSQAFTGLKFEPSATYAIRVRHKASDDKWSPWSLDQVFYTKSCLDTKAGLTHHWDFSDTANITLVGGKYSQINDKVGTMHLSETNDLYRPAQDTTYFTQGAAKFIGDNGFNILNGPLKFDADGVNPCKSTVVMVARVTTGNQYTFLGFSSSNDIGSSTAKTVGVFSSTVGTQQNRLTCTATSTDIIQSAAGSVPDDTKSVIEFVINSDGNHKFYVNGTEVASALGSAENFLTMSFSWFNRQSGPYKGGNHQIAEVLWFDSAISDEQRTALRAELKSKWGTV